MERERQRRAEDPATGGTREPEAASGLTFNELSGSASVAIADRSGPSFAARYDAGGSTITPRRGVTS